MEEHIIDHLKKPQLVKLSKQIYVLRFEVMKFYSALAALEKLIETSKVKPGEPLAEIKNYFLFFKI